MDEQYLIAELEFDLRFEGNKLIDAKQELKKFMDINHCTINEKNYKLYMRLSNLVSFQCGVVNTYHEILQSLGEEVDISDYITIFDGKGDA